MLQSDDLLDVTVLITDQKRYRVWLARGRSLLEQPAWTSAPELPALKLLLRAEIEKLLLLIPALLLSCEKGELLRGEANKPSVDFSVTGGCRVRSASLPGT